MPPSQTIACPLMKPLCSDCAVRSKDESGASAAGLPQARLVPRISIRETAREQFWPSAGTDEAHRGTVQGKHGHVQRHPIYTSAQRGALPRSRRPQRSWPGPQAGKPPSRTCSVRCGSTCTIAGLAHVGRNGFGKCGVFSACGVRAVVATMAGRACVCTRACVCACLRACVRCALPFYRKPLLVEVHRHGGRHAGDDPAGENRVHAHAAGRRAGRKQRQPSDRPIDPCGFVARFLKKNVTGRAMQRLQRAKHGGAGKLSVNGNLRRGGVACRRAGPLQSGQAR